MDLLGRDPSALEADLETWLGWVHPQDRDIVLMLYQECVSSRRSEYTDVDFRWLSGSGAWKWLRSVGRVVEWDETGRPLRLLGTHLDITDRKKAEDALRLTQVAVDRAVVGIYWFDAEGRLVDVNDEACRSLGYSRDELIGATTALFDPEFTDQRYAELWDQLRTSGSALFETQPRRTDGVSIIVEVACNYISVADKEYNVSFARAITARKAAETRLRHHLSSEKALADVSALMIKPGWDDLDWRLNWVLERVGSLAGAARSFLFEISKDGRRARNTHEWCGQGIAPQVAQLQALSLADAPAFYAGLQRGEVVEAEALASDHGRVFKPVLLEPGLHRLICIPVRWDDRSATPAWSRAPWASRSKCSRMRSILEHCVARSSPPSWRIVARRSRCSNATRSAPRTWSGISRRSPSIRRACVAVASTCARPSTRCSPRCARP